ncbi:class I SAM-dependent methyltransferase [Frondihabitans cladoniiphilus]|uniref:S-adenosyl-L-methionine-dependent methyltransferase n=1 Tax=Frondihabitans cladoniiphilus TaxID=715785 RepID=A0ABP8W868_9MICO
MTTFDLPDLTTVNETALLVALRRASESTRHDAMFHDVLAETVAALIPDLSMSPAFWQAAHEMEELSGDAVALRTQHFDEQIQRAVRNGVRQVVILGAGLDARSHRLNLNPHTRFFEIDQPAVLNARHALIDAAELTPKYRTRTIAASIPRDDLKEKLRLEGFDRATPTVFVAEGLVFYLSADDLRRLLIDISALSAPGSHLLADYPADRPLHTHDDGAETSVTATFDKDAKSGPWELFESADWLLGCRSLTNLAATYGRALPREIDALRGGARWWYVGATRV